MNRDSEEARGSFGPFRPRVSHLGRRRRRTRRLEVEELESRDVPIAFAVELPGAGAYRLAQDGGGRVVLTQGATEIFARPRSEVTSLRIAGTPNDETVTIDFTRLTGTSSPLALDIVGGGGADSVSVQGPDGPYRADLGPGGGRITGAALDVSLSAFPAVDVVAHGGQSYAWLDGSSGDDQFSAKPEAIASMRRADGTTTNVIGFAGVNAHGRGGADTADLYDTPGDDQLVMRAGYTLLKRGEDVFSRALDFPRVSAHGTDAGHDTAWLYDTAADDVVNMTEGYTTFESPDGTFFAVTDNFEDIRPLSVVGGRDTIWIYDTPRNDDLRFSPAGYSLFQNDQREFAWRFFRFYSVNVRASAGYDVATLYDTSATEEFFGPNAANGLVTYTNVPRDFNLYVMTFDRFILFGGAGERNLINFVPQWPPQFAWVASNYIPMSTFYAGLAPRTDADNPLALYNARLVFAVAGATPLQRLRSIVLLRDRRLAGVTDPLQLALLLRDHVHQQIDSGVSTPYLQYLDPYSRYLATCVWKAERVYCGGITLVYADVLRAFGLEVRMVNLTVGDGVNFHGSVEFKLGGSWVAMDATFNVSFRAADGRPVSYAEMRAGIPYTISRDGFGCKVRLDISKYPVPYSEFLHVITYS